MSPVASARKRATKRAARDGIVAPPPAPLRPTLGPLVCRWIEQNLVHGEGDFYGKPFKLRGWQRAFIYEAYELRPDGSRHYDEALLGIPKGNGKTELAAAIACAELGGPVVFDGWKADGTPKGKRRISPDIPIAAASFEQADKLFGAAKIMIGKGRLDNFFEVFDTEIQERGGPGRMYRVAAVAGTNDGGRHSFVGCDEVHEWIGKRERVHLVLSNNRTKRAGSWELNISTAGASVRSLLGRMYTRGLKIRDGKIDAPRILFRWYGLDPKSPLGEHLDDPAKLREAIRQANPGADDFVDVEKVAGRYHTTPEHEFRRYFLNQFVDAPEIWLPSKNWSACADAARGEPEEGAEVVLSLEGNSSRDSVGLVAATVEPKPHIFVVKCWQGGESTDDDSESTEPKAKKVSLSDVEQAIRDAAATWDVRLVAINPNRFPHTIETLQEDFGERLVEYESHKPALMVPACSTFYDAVTGADDQAGPQITHDGSEALSAHFSNAMTKEDGRGKRITKDKNDPGRCIELAVAAVVALDLVQRAMTDDNNDDWRPVV